MHLKKFFLNLKKNNVFLYWLASYAVILVVPIILGSIAYFVSIDTINEEVNKAESASLNQFKTVVDGKLQEINRLSSILIFNPKVMKLEYLDQPFNENDLITINELQLELGKFKISNQYIDNIYIYFTNNYILLTDKYMYGEDEIDSLSGEAFGMNASDLIKFVRDKQMKSYMIVEEPGKKGAAASSRIIFFQSVYSADLKSTKGSLIVTVNMNKFLALMGNLQWNTHGKAMIIDESDNRILNGKTGLIPGTLNYNRLGKENPIFYENVNGNTLAVAQTKSEVTDWRYLFLIPSKEFLKKAQYVKNTIYIYICLCLLLGCIISYAFARKNYNPVKKMMQLFINRLGRNPIGEKNEFSFLETSLNDLLDENDNNVARLKQQNEAMRNNIFVRLLKGRIGDMEDARASLAAYGMELPSERFAVMIYSIGHMNLDVFGEKPLEDEETRNLIFFIIRNVVEELAGEKHSGFMFEIDGMMACLVNIKDQEEELAAEAVQTDLQDIALRSSELFESKFGIELSVSISEAQTGIQGIMKAYSQALEIIEYQSLTGGKNAITHFSTVYSEWKGEFRDSYNLEKERQFINFIQAEDYMGARDLIDGIISSYLGSNVKSLQILKCRMFGFINSMLNMIWEIQSDVDVEFFEELNPVNRLLNTKSIVELRSQIYFILEQIGEYFHAKSAERVPAWVADIETFIREKYYDQNLSIGSISERFAMNISYISKAYKKYRGIGLLDTIHKVRLEKAKDLMNTELSIKDIANKVGYADSKAMIRSFKRYEGITPGKFRESE